MIGKAARNSYLVAFFNALKKEDSKLKLSVDELISYAIPIIFNEKTIPVWEKWLDLSEALNWTLEGRRKRIINTINSNQSCTEQFLKDQASVFTNEKIEISQQFEEYNFIIQFISVIGVPPNLDNFKQIVNVNKPAHLTFDTKIRYRTHKELKEYTHIQLSKYTHKEIKEKSILIKGGI